jgi:hypothetical protein
MAMLIFNSVERGPVSRKRILKLWTYSQSAKEKFYE